MTVGEMIRELAKHPLDLPVWVGLKEVECDCGKYILDPASMEAQVYDASSASMPRVEITD